MPFLWTDEEFDLVAKNVGQSTKTLAACRDVLVEGLSGVDAAKKHQTFATHISRSINALNEQKKLLEAANAKASGGLLLSKSEAALSAKNLLGPGLMIVDAVIGNTYDGAIVAMSDLCCVQHIGRFGVLHELDRLKQPPNINVNAIISYPANGDKAFVNEKVTILSKEKHGVER